ncbi:MAG: carbohydrate porin [Planctomycetes bacterium]|nr:carbohydrate porin [Planctomycetota bacterium]
MQSRLLMLFIVPSLACAVEAPYLATSGTGPLEGPTLLGDLGGLRSGFAQHGLALEARIIADGMAYSRDGLVTGERNGVRYFIEAGLTMDIAAFIGLAGAGSITGTWQTLAGDDLLGETGVLQNESWINTVDRNQVGRLFYVQPFFDGGFTIKVGKDEVVRDFGRNPFAAEFLNTASRSEPTAWAMPTFPDSATMALAALDIGGWVARFGIYDGRSVTDGKKTGEDWLSIPDDDVFMIAEIGFTNDDRRRGHQSGLVLGAWQHSGTFTTFAGDTKEDVRGYYVQGDLMLVSGSDPRKPEGLAGWIQLGMSENDEFSVYDRHLGIGLVWRGLIPSRADDTIGISHSWLETSRATGAPSDADERVLEIFYGFKAAGWLTIQPDFQWFVHPGGISSEDDLFIGSLRGVVLF